MDKNQSLICTTLRGLTFTALEKKCVLGEDAKEDIARIRAMVEDLVYFWDLDERYLEQFDMDIAD
jgi:hypothetical protein